MSLCNQRTWNFSVVVDVLEVHISDLCFRSVKSSCLLKYLTIPHRVLVTMEGLGFQLKK